MHELLVTWFQFSKDWGYAGVFVMMALESTIVPVPSEIIMPPAAYWASQGELSMAGVVLAGGLGSTFGSSLTYLFTATLGRAFIARWGRYLLLPPARLELAERWLATYQTGGVFIARLLPVVRHLIGIPAGIVRMNYWKFSAFTLVGSALWCGVLCWVGLKAGNDAALMQGELHRVALWLFGALAVLGVIYWSFVHRHMKPAAK